MTALARPAGAGLVAAVLLVASGLAGPAPAAHATSRLPTPCPSAGLEIVRDLPRWAIPIRGRSILAAFEGRLTGRRVRAAAELEVDGSHSPPGLRVWTFAVERVLAGTLPPTVEVWSEGRARTAAGGSRAPDGTVPLVVGEQYQVTALWLPPPWVMADPAHARLWPQCANRWRWSEHVPWADGHAPAPRPVLVVLAATAHLRAHGLGGTTASLPLALGTGAPTTATVLGHAQPSTTLDFYGHAIPSNVRTAAGQLTHPPGATGPRAARRRRTRG